MIQDIQKVIPYKNGYIVFNSKNNYFYVTFQGGVTYFHFFGEVLRNGELQNVHIRYSQETIQYLLHALHMNLWQLVAHIRICLYQDMLSDL